MTDAFFVAEKVVYFAAEWWCTFVGISNQEEKRRQIDYDRRNEMAELEKLLHSNSKQFHVLNLNDVIQYDEKVHEQLTAELNELGSELRPILMDQNATYGSPIEVHVENESYDMVGR